jgi:hypothetical protein
MASVARLANPLIARLHQTSIFAGFTAAKRSRSYVVNHDAGLTGAAREIRVNRDPDKRRDYG